MDRKEIRFRTLLKYYFERYDDNSNIEKINWIIKKSDKEWKDAEIVLCENKLLAGEINLGNGGSPYFTAMGGISNSGRQQIEDLLTDLDQSVVYPSERTNQLNEQIDNLINALLSNDKPISEVNSLAFDVIVKYF